MHGAKGARDAHVIAAESVYVLQDSYLSVHVACSWLLILQLSLCSSVALPLSFWSCRVHELLNQMQKEVRVGVEGADESQPVQVAVVVINKMKLSGGTG